MADRNPILVFYDGVVRDLLKPHPELSDRINKWEGHGIQEDLNPIPGEPVQQYLYQPDQYPVFRIYHLGIDPWLFRDSDDTSMVVYFAFQTLTDTRLLDEITDIQFWTAVALHKWRTKRADWKWNGEAFVKFVRAIKSRSDLADQEENRGHGGWQDICTGEAEFFLSQSLLEGFNP